MTRFLGCERATPERSDSTRVASPSVCDLEQVSGGHGRAEYMCYTQDITGCGARCTTGGHDAVMSGEIQHQAGVGIRERGRGSSQ